MKSSIKSGDHPEHTSNEIKTKTIFKTNDGSLYMRRQHVSTGRVDVARSLVLSVPDKRDSFKCNFTLMIRIENEENT